MCRSIKKLRSPDQRAGDAEVREAALQFVRKISGYRSPSRANHESFDGAVEDIAAVSRRLLDSLVEGRAGARPHRDGGAASPEARRGRSGQS